MSTIDYSKLPRLAELCAELSDRGIASERLTVEFEITNGPFFENLRLALRSYHPRHEFNHALMMMNTTRNVPVSIDEMIATLEQIQAYGFRDQQDTAA